MEPKFFWGIPGRVFQIRCTSRASIAAYWPSSLTSIADILSSDFESFYRLMPGHKVGVLNEIAGLWRQHPANTSHNASHRDVVKNLDLFKSTYTHARSVGILPWMTLNRWRSDAFVEYFSHHCDRYLSEKRPLDALRLAMSVVARLPTILFREEFRIRLGKIRNSGRVR
jgi:hypothetical protein